MAFIDQVQDLTSLTVSDNDELSQFLKDGVLDVTSRWLAIRPQDIELFGRESSETTSNASLNLNNARIISVIREDGTNNQWRNCRKISPALQYDVTDVDSLNYASKINPAYTLLHNGKINVFPSAAVGGANSFKVYYANNEPTDLTNNAALIHSHSDIQYFPADKVYLVVMYAGMRSLQANLGAINISTFSLSASAPVAIPGNPSITGVSVGSITVASLPTAPDYVSPTTTISGETWAAEYAHAEVDLATALTALKNNIDLSNAVLDALPVPPDTPDTPELSSVGTAPEYTKQSLSNDVQSAITTFIDTDEDVELAQAKIQQFQASLTEYQADMQNELNEFNKENVVFQATIQREVQEDTLILQKYQADLAVYQAEIGAMSAQSQGYLQTAQGYANEIKTRLSATQVKVSEYQIRVQDALNEFNDANVVYQAGIQRNIQQAQIDMQDAQKEADIDLQEKIQDYTLELQRVSTDQQKYQGLVNAEIQTYQQEIAEKNAEYQWMAARIKDLKEEYDAAFMIAAPKPQQPQARR